MGPATTKTIVFDLDGTLVDSVRDLIPALNKTTALDNLPPIAREDVGHVVGQGALKMIALAFQFHGRPLSRERQLELLPMFLEHYEANIATETIFYDGCLDALDVLQEQGWRLAVCTNKYEGLARNLLGQLGETERFCAITGGDTFDFKKPDPRHITETVKLAKGEQSQTIMIGDTINDIAAAQNANLPSIGIDFGYTDVPVTELGATAVISHFDELVAAVEEIEANNFQA